MSVDTRTGKRGNARDEKIAAAFAATGRAEIKTRQVPRRQSLMGKMWSHQVYGKRHRAFQLVSRHERLKKAVRIGLVVALMLGLAALVEPAAVGALFADR